MKLLFPHGIYLHMLPYFLLGYAVGGRAFAYLGIPPLYMGEILLLFGLLQTITATRGLHIFSQVQPWLLGIFMFWSAMQTAPYIPEYGMLALRDAALWGYGLFAFIIAIILVSHPPFLVLLLERYRIFVNLFPPIAVLGLIALIFFKRAFFDVSAIMQMKPGDILVQLAGVTAFAACGLMHRRPLLWMIAVAAALVIAGSEGRGGLLAFCVVFGFVILLRLRYIETWKIILSFCVIMLILGTALVCLPDSQSQIARKKSPGQLVKNIASIFVPSEQWGLEGTKRYRLEWWDKIIDYTFYGDYFLGGKGYGINLAVSDDQVIKGDTSLRNPHNAHLTILARSGVPGLILWVTLNLAWFIGMMRCIIQAKRFDLIQWEGWFCTLLAFYLAALVNATFDVYLEGPMGGVWFWTVFGIGMASMHLYDRFPEIMAEHENPDPA